MSEFKKHKKWTDEQKQEIINYAKENGLWSVKGKYNVWPESVRYWMMSSQEKEQISKAGKERHKNKRNDLEYKKRSKLYRDYRKSLGLTSVVWKEWYNNLAENQKKELNDSIKQHRLDNLKHYKAKARERYLKDKESGILRKKYNEDPLHKMRCNIREHVRQAVKYSNLTKDHPSIRYLGCSIEEFKQYIESKFVTGMTWENHSRGENCWHLDHIKPLACLKDVSDINTLKEVCHYTNYQPLWERDNLSKQDRYEE